MELSEIVAEVEFLMNVNRLPLWEIHLRVNPDKHDLDVLTSYLGLERYAKKENMKFDEETLFTGSRVPCVYIEKENYNLRLFAYGVRKQKRYKKV